MTASHNYYLRFPESIHLFFWTWHSYSESDSTKLAKKAREFWKGGAIELEPLPLFESVADRHKRIREENRKRLGYK